MRKERSEGVDSVRVEWSAYEVGELGRRQEKAQCGASCNGGY